MKKIMTTIEENRAGGFCYGRYSENGRHVCFFVGDIPSEENNYSPSAQPFAEEVKAKDLFDKLVSRGFVSPSLK